MKNNFIEIDGRKIGTDYNPLVIAEIGINHNGSLEIAKEMVDSAHRAGCEIIKNQTHIVSDEMSHEAKKVIPGNADISIYEIMENASISEDDEIKLKEYVETKEKVEALKTECNNYPLIEHIAKFGKPMIISTGMNDIESVRKTVEIVEKYNIPYILMHTTNLYPTPANLVRLGALEELKNNFPNAIIGLSDHTMNNNACLSATALGACVLERHFTDTKDRIGPDIICSADEKELEELIKGTKQIHQMLGGNKAALKEEQVTIDFAFATIVTIKPIKKGDKFTKENIWVKKPGKIGIKAEKYNELLGRIATVDIPNDTHVLEGMFE